MRLILSLALLFSAAVASAQSGSATSSSSDSLKSFLTPEVEVTGIRAPKRTLRDVESMGIFSSKKTEVIQMQGSNGNFSLNNTRQAFVRAPGVFIWEQDGSGVQAGVAVRGLSPNRSWEFNTRKDGYDISADIFGYPEAYYTPPFESLERIELVRGSASLQFGPQFGGLLNYVTKSAPRDRSFSLVCLIAIWSSIRWSFELRHQICTERQVFFFGKFSGRRLHWILFHLYGIRRHSWQP